MHSLRICLAFEIVTLDFGPSVNETKTARLVSMCLKVEQQYQKSGDAEAWQTTALGPLSNTATSVARAQAEEPHVSKDAPAGSSAQLSLLDGSRS